MCPDREMISIYFDEELPSPWKEKMEAHLESCNECRAALNNYKNLGSFLLKTRDTKNLEAVQERVWEKINSQPKSSSNAEHRIKKARFKSALGWRVSLPLPAAAAALIFIIFFALFGFRLFNRGTTHEPITASIPEFMHVVGDDQGMLPIQDMTGVLQYLSSQEYGDFMVIRLPESRTFSRIGEPALINAADYSRRNTSR